MLVGFFSVSRLINSTFLFVGLCIIMPVQLFGQQAEEVRGGRNRHMQFYYEKGQDALDSNHYQDAIEYFEFNINGAYVGEFTPFYLTT